MINICKVFVYALGIFAIVSCFNSNTPAQEDVEQIQSLPVRFAIDRAGLVGADGPTHA